jgi:uncharacterized protein YeeX (DUF496 family)
METTISPNQQTAATESQAVQSLDQVIADKMTAMRNQLQDPTQTATGQNPVAPNSSDAVPEVDDADNSNIDTADYEADAQETVSPDSSNSTADELIDFLEFAETNPNAKFKFMRNGKEVVVDAKKAASILGQGSAIHEEARQLKVDRAEFDEYLNEVRARQEGLTLAMEFTIQPKLQGAYDEILKTQTYQSTFQQQLNQTRDPAQRAKIQASIQHNENYIRQQQQVIGQLQPAVEQFKQVRAQQVTQVLTHARKNFQDKELKNDYVFNEVRDKIAKIWPHARQEIIPGVANIDLISSDENLLSLVRDGLRYRDKPTTKSAGASMAQLTGRKGASNTSRSTEGNIEKLREQAKAGDKNAADNLLVAQLQRMRQGRGGR